MSSDQETTKLPPVSEADKEDVVASVRLSAQEEKDIRRAAVELNQTRSEFMAVAAVDRARTVLAQHPARAS